MRSHIKFTIIVFLLTLSSSVCMGQEAVGTEDASERVALTFPYVSELIADNVYVRSGPGTNYYACGKLDRGSRVQVVSTKFSWSCIVPPTGSFSWISSQYVSIDSDDRSVGVVTGDAVRVYVGSENLKPIHSTTPLPKRNKGDKVILLGEETDGYYKIVPPSGSYFWVSTKFLKPLGAAEEVEIFVEPVEPVEQKDVKIEAIIASSLPVEAEELNKYYELEKQVKAERVKPVGKQNYSAIKKSLTEIAGNKRAGKAARYSKFALDQIERYELVFSVDKELERQSRQLQQARQRIDKALARRLEQTEDLGRFAAIGTFENSAVYSMQAGSKHYRVLTNSGKTICYALPTDTPSNVDLSRFIGKRVGLVGTIEPYQQTASALVQFVEIVELN